VLLKQERVQRDLYNHKIHPKFKMPLNALALISFVCFILSLIYIASSTAFNAIISLSALALSVSYIIPITFFMLRKMRGPKLDYGPFTLGRWGIPINMFSLAYLLYITIWMPFPQIRPVTGKNMNYAGPVFLAFVLGALVDWFISGHKRFTVPVARPIHEY
jgi:choline transport protein